MSIKTILINACLATWVSSAESPSLDVLWHRTLDQAVQGGALRTTDACSHLDSRTASLGDSQYHRSSSPVVGVRRRDCGGYPSRLRVTPLQCPGVPHPLLPRPSLLVLFWTDSSLYSSLPRLDLQDEEVVGTTNNHNPTFDVPTTFYNFNGISAVPGARPSARATICGSDLLLRMARSAEQYDDPMSGSQC